MCTTNDKSIMCSCRTSILQEIGVWRIYCDTDTLNTLMIDAFRSVGYKQFGPPEKKPL